MSTRPLPRHILTTRQWDPLSGHHLPKEPCPLEFQFSTHQVIVFPTSWTYSNLTEHILEPQSLWLQAGHAEFKAPFLSLWIRMDTFFLSTFHTLAESRFKETLCRSNYAYMNARTKLRSLQRGALCIPAHSLDQYPIAAMRKPVLSQILPSVKFSHLAESWLRNWVSFGRTIYVVVKFRYLENNYLK